MSQESGQAGARVAGAAWIVEKTNCKCYLHEVQLSFRLAARPVGGIHTYICTYSYSNRIVLLVVHTPTCMLKFM